MTGRHRPRFSVTRFPLEISGNDYVEITPYSTSDELCLIVKETDHHESYVFLTNAEARAIGNAMLDWAHGES